MKVNWREMRAVLAALAANLGIAITKFIAFLVSGSASMLAESVHSVADTGNELLLLVGRGRADRPATGEHPFGFGRERYFYGFIVSVMLFTVGAAFSVYDGIHKIINPEEIHGALIAFIVLAVSAVMEGFSLRTGIREANVVRGGRSWGTFIRRTKAPELPVVLLEDTAAMIGLAFAFIPVSIGALTGVRPSEAGLASGLINTSQQIGGAIGVVLSYLISWAVGTLPMMGPLFEDDSGQGDIHLRISIMTVFLSGAVLLLVGVISGLVPALRASKLDPVEALRYE